LRTLLALGSWLTRRPWDALFAGHPSVAGRTAKSLNALFALGALFALRARFSLLALVALLRLEGARLDAGGVRGDHQCRRDRRDEKHPGDAQHHGGRHGTGRGSQTQTSSDTSNNGSHMRRLTHSRHAALDRHEGISDNSRSAASDRVSSARCRGVGNGTPPGLGDPASTRKDGGVTADREPWQTDTPLPPVSPEQWRASVNAVLARRRGDLSDAELDRLFQKTLTTTTDDGIVLQPLYRADDQRPDPGLPGQHAFVRGVSADGPTPDGWDVRQRVVVGADVAAAQASALAELERGATSLWLDLGDQPPSADLLDSVLADVKLDLAPVVLASSSPVAAAESLLDLWRRRDVPDASATGCLGLDPLGRYAASGGTTDVDADLSAATSLAQRAALPGVRALVADASIYHDAGASEADEVALVTATLTDYLRALVAAGLDVDAAVAQVEVRLAASDNQFATIAKLRAARRLVARVAEVAGASASTAAPPQHAVTSRAMLTRYDPWVNLLRTTVAGFAAGVGGADAVTVDPHDLLLRAAGQQGLDTALSTRLARNVQTILVEESHLARVIDPAGGSWFVEQLTDDLARRAWERFGEIERVGGVAQALRAGIVSQWIADAVDARSQRIARRTQPITGVSEFPNPADVAPPLPKPAPASTPFAAVTPDQYAGDFERLRDRASAHTAGAAPSVFLATLGPLAEHTARTAFTTNLFATGGITAVEAGTVTAETVADAFASSGAALACICGSDKRYSDEAVATAQALAAASPARLYLAGHPGDLRDALDAAGVAEYVVAGGDAPDLLDRALTAAGVR
jgi:methylmalonyl-CoA mutase